LGLESPDGLGDGDSSAAGDSLASGDSVGDSLEEGEFSLRIFSGRNIHPPINVVVANSRLAIPRAIFGRFIQRFPQTHILKVGLSYHPRFKETISLDIEGMKSLATDWALKPQADSGAGTRLPAKIFICLFYKFLLIYWQK
jgi:hypothetical protein